VKGIKVFGERRAATFCGAVSLCEKWLARSHRYHGVVSLELLRPGNPDYDDNSSFGQEHDVISCRQTSIAFYITEIMPCHEAEVYHDSWVLS